MTDRLDVLFLGTHGQYNIGDELLLETFLTRLGTQHRYRVNSYDPQMTEKQLADFHVEVFDTAGDRIGVLKRLRACDVVVFGGGSIVKELGSTTGRWRYATMAMLLALVTAARMLRTPTLMSNIGVGPIATPFGRRLARAVLGQVTLVSLRDQASFDLCVSLGCDRDKLRLVPDAVWSVAPEDVTPADPELGERPPAGADPIVIGLNLNRDIRVPERWDDFLAELRRALRTIAKDREIRLVGLPMQTGFKNDDDADMLAAFFETVPEIESSVAAADDQRDIARRAAACHVVVAERLHALVIAAIIARPIVALSYDPKVTELADQLDLGPRAFDVNEPLDVSALAAQIVAAATDGAEPARLDSIAARKRTEARTYFSAVSRWLDARGRHRRWRDLGLD